MWTHLSPYNRKRRGFVLVAVLLSVSILVTGSLAFAWFSRTELRKAEANAFSLEARSLAETVVHAVRKGLLLDRNSYDSALEPWFGTWPVPLGAEASVTVTLSPQNRALPLAGLFLPDGSTLRRELEEPWETLWEEAGKPGLAPVVLDFLDADRTPRPGGSETDSCIDRAPSALEELLLCPGIDESLYYGKNGKGRPGLGRLLTVHADGKINFNAAHPEALALLDPSLTPGVIREIVERRAKKPLEGWGDLAGISGFPPGLRPRLDGLVSFASSHFLAEIEVRKGTLVRRFEAVLVKDSGRCRISSWKER